MLKRLTADDWLAGADPGDSRDAYIATAKAVAACNSMSVERIGMDEIVAVDFDGAAMVLRLYRSRMPKFAAQDLLRVRESLSAIRSGTAKPGQLL